MVKASEHISKRGVGFFPLVVTLAGFGLFLVIVYLFWMEKRPPTVAQGGFSPQERKEILTELRARDHELLTEYGWVDQEQEIVRLPIDRAIELTLAEMNERQTQN